MAGPTIKKIVALATKATNTAGKQLAKGLLKIATPTFAPRLIDSELSNIKQSWLSQKKSYQDQLAGAAAMAEAKINATTNSTGSHKSGVQPDVIPALADDSFLKDVKIKFPYFDTDLAFNNMFLYGYSLMNGTSYHPPIVDPKTYGAEFAKMGEPEFAIDPTGILKYILTSYSTNNKLPLILKNARDSGINLSQDQIEHISQIYKTPLDGFNLSIGYLPPGITGNSLGIFSGVPSIGVIEHETEHKIREKLGDYLSRIGVSRNFVRNGDGTIKYPDLLSTNRQWANSDINLPAYFPTEMDALQPLAMRIKDRSDLSPMKEIATVAQEQRFLDWLNFGSKYGFYPNNWLLNKVIKSTDPKVYWDHSCDGLHSGYMKMIGGEKFDKLNDLNDQLKELYPNDPVAQELAKRDPKSAVGTDWQNAVTKIGAVAAPFVIGTLPGQQDNYQNNMKIQNE